MSFQERTRSVAFFAAELKFVDKSTWKANLDDIQRMADVRQGVPWLRFWFNCFRVRGRDIPINYISNPPSS